MIIKVKSIGWILAMVLGVLGITSPSASAQALVSALLDRNVAQTLELTDYQVQSLISLYQQLEQFRGEAEASMSYVNPTYPSAYQQALSAYQRQIERIADIEKEGVAQILSPAQRQMLFQMMRGY